MVDKDLFSPKKQETTVELVINNIKNLLMSKKLLPGDRIPSELELAETMNVSRGSVREAMKILAAFGIVEIKRGDGTYIAKTYQKVVLDPFLFNLILSNPNTEEIVELRELMELEIIRLIIRNADEIDLQVVGQSLRLMEEKINDQSIDEPEDLVNLDLAFHHSLGKAANNILVEKIYDFILDFFTPTIKESYCHQENGQNALKLHKNIFKALLSQDLDQALEAVSKSILAWKLFFK